MVAEDNDDGTDRKPEIMFSVADTGIGLCSDDFEKIFEPFQQVDSSASRQYQGTGLGLSLTKQLVELQGGKIWVQSLGEGRDRPFISQFQRTMSIQCPIQFSHCLKPKS